MARQLFELITDHLDINEAEYFGIYILLKNDQRKWLRLDKEIKKQLKGNNFSFSMISHSLERNLMEHIDMKNS